jgi:hypothetical protein
MIEAIAFAVICYFLCHNCSTHKRLKKAVGGAILFIILFFSYNTLQPLLPTEIDHLLHSSIWGVLFAYAVPNQTKSKNKQQETEEKKNDIEKEPKEN